MENREYSDQEKAILTTISQKTKKDYFYKLIIGSYGLTTEKAKEIVQQLINEGIVKDDGIYYEIPHDLQGNWFDSAVAEAIEIEEELANKD